MAETKATPADVKAAKDACEGDFGKCLAKATFEEGPLPVTKGDGKNAQANGAGELLDPSSSSNLIRTKVAADPEPNPAPPVKP